MSIKPNFLIITIKKQKDDKGNSFISSIGDINNVRFMQ